jgi:hypothetical protein
MVAFAIATLVARQRAGRNTNWVLLYFFIVFGYNSIYPDRIHPYLILAGTTCAGLLRFEFLPRALSVLVMIAEAAILVVIAYHLWGELRW